MCLHLALPLLLSKHIKMIEHSISFHNRKLEIPFFSLLSQITNNRYSNKILSEMIHQINDNKEEWKHKSVLTNKIVN